MSPMLYLKSVAWEALLVAVASMALGYTLYNAFYIAPTLQYSPAGAICMAVLTVALFCVGYSGRTVRIGGVLYAIVCIIALAAAAGISGETFLTDSEQSYFFFALVTVLAPTLVYLLSRRLLGCAFVFIIGAFVCGWAQFFYERYELAWTIAFVLAGIALVIYRNYGESARSATSVRSLSFGAGAAVSLGAVVAVVGVACLLWFAVIAPLNPGALDIKLITEHRALETVQVKGTSAEYLTPNMELTSDQTNDSERTVDDLKESDDGKEMPAKMVDDGSAQTKASGSFMGIDISSIQQAFDFKADTQTALRNWLLLILIPLVIIVGFFVGRRILRNKRLARIQEQDAGNQVRELYRFATDKLARVGYAIPAGATVLEFARNNEQGLAVFESTADTNFLRMSEVYAGVVYGGREDVSEEELKPFVEFYKGFWKAARKRLGAVKYFFKSFRL